MDYENNQSHHHYLPSARSPRACSYCGKVFATLYALGGHMTAHRMEMEKTRKEHNANITQMVVTTAKGKRQDNSNPEASYNVIRPIKTFDFLGLGPLLESDGDKRFWKDDDDNGDKDKSLKDKGLDLSLKL